MMDCEALIQILFIFAYSLFPFDAFVLLTVMLVQVIQYYWDQTGLALFHFALLLLKQANSSSIRHPLCLLCAAHSLQISPATKTSSEGHAVRSDIVSPLKLCIFFLFTHLFCCRFKTRINTLSCRGQ